MSIVSGYKKFKKYILTSSGFQLVSHWTNANTLQFDDGKTAQAKLGAIDGISSSKDSSSDKIAASTKLVSELNSNFDTKCKGRISETLSLSDTTMNTYLRHLSENVSVNERALNGGLDFWALVNSSAIYTGSIQCDYAYNYWGTIHQHNSTDIYSFTITRGADAVIKKLGSKISMPYIYHNGQGNNGADVFFALDGHTKLFIGSIGFTSDISLFIRGDDKLLAQYNRQISNISIDISGMTQLKISYGGGWVGKDGYGNCTIRNLTIT